MLFDASADFIIGHLTKSSGAPLVADAPPTFRIFGPNGATVGDGAADYLSQGAITGATNATPIVVTSAGHGLAVGMLVTITGVVGNTAANVAAARISAVAANTFTLEGSVGNGAYVSGGTWVVTGLYKLPITSAIRSQLEARKTYTCVVYWKQSNQPRADQFTFTVV